MADGVALDGPRTGIGRVPGRVPARLALPALAAALAAAALAALGAGAVSIPPAEAAALLLQGAGPGADPAATAREAVLTSIRLPRVLLGMLTGAGLALAGAALQGLFRNPLADPALIGVSAGAALAATVVIVMGAVWLPGLTRALGYYTLPLAAFAGGLAVALAVYRLANFEGRTSLAVMLLAGIAANALAMACVGLFTFIASDEQLRNLTFWNLGSLAGATWPVLWAIAPPVALAAAGLTRCAGALNAFALGEAAAGHLGVAVQRVKLGVVVLSALAVGVLTAVTGIIGFIGLVAPHLVRLACGPDHRVVLPGSALLGAILVVSADLAARTLAIPAELPIGVLTAVLGVPFFLVLLARQRRVWDA